MRVYYLIPVVFIFSIHLFAQSVSVNGTLRYTRGDGTVEPIYKARLELLNQSGQSYNVFTHTNSNGGFTFPAVSLSGTSVKIRVYSYYYNTGSIVVSVANFSTNSFYFKDTQVLSVSNSGSIGSYIFPQDTSGFNEAMFVLSRLHKARAHTINVFQQVNIIAGLSTIVAWLNANNT